MVRLLIVEDSPVVRDFLVHIMSSDPEIEIVGTANDGLEAIEAVERLKPDIVTMDVNMPRLNGLDATRIIMETNPTPIVIVSGSYDSAEVASTFRAIEAGALTVLPRPVGMGHPEFATQARGLVRSVKAMSEVKVVRRFARSRKVEAPSSATEGADRAPRNTDALIKLIAVGASTGGPIALQSILKLLPNDFGVPIAIVQHMASGFVQGFTEWLSQSCGMEVRVAQSNERLLPGNVYVAPDDFHLMVAQMGQLVLSDTPPENSLRPSVSVFFRSVSKVFGREAVGVLLTGMGTDGANGLLAMKERGAITFAQDQASSVVHGMPGEAIRLGAAAYVLPPEEIAAALVKLVPSK
ncbi:MAG TPA: chemotaxis-specific protein-glutamate methyltransferase CheB [Spirochaetia bacterium]|nr:chemotaxis-specific protein-glutamate methyltransferase CheB [Spirochaetia bacterium]